MFELDLGCTELTSQDMSEALPHFSRLLNLNNTSHRVEQALPPGVRSIRSIQTASVCGPHRAHHLHIHLTSTSPHTPHTMTHNHLTSPRITSPHLTSPHIHLTSTSPHTPHTMTHHHLTSHHLTTPHITTHPPHLHLTSHRTYHDLQAPHITSHHLTII